MKGYTLIEVALAVGILALAAVMGTMVLLQAHQTAVSFEAYSGESMERLTAEAILRSVFADALDVKFAGSASLNHWSNSPGSTGVIREFDSDTAFGQAPSVHTLGVFWREGRASARQASEISGMASDFKRTALFFQKPTPETHGVFYLDLGSGVGLAPRRSQFFMEGLTRLRIFNVLTYPSASAQVREPVTSFDLAMTFRRFPAAPDGTRYTFCPQAFLQTRPECAAQIPSRDVTRTLRLVLRNNMLAVSPSGPATSGVGRGARLYDRIHFFKPLVSGGLL